MATTLSMLAQGLLPVTLPLLAVQLGRTTAGGAWLLTAISCGGLLGALASHRLLARWTPRTVLITALAGFGGCLAALAAMPDLTLALGLAVLAGLAEGPALAATLTVRRTSRPITTPRSPPPPRASRRAAMHSVLPSPACSPVSSAAASCCWPSRRARY